MGIINFILNHCEAVTYWKYDYQHRLQSDSNSMKQSS